MLAAGTYKARAVQGVLGQAGNGTDQVGVEFELTDPEVAGQRIAWYGFFTEKALETTLRALRTCGWQGQDLSDLSGIDANEVSLVVEHEEYEGATRARVRWVNGAGGLAMKAPMQADQAKSFAARMRGAVAAFDQLNGAKRAQARTASERRPEPPPLTDRDAPPGADIPF